MKKSLTIIVLIAVVLISACSSDSNKESSDKEKTSKNATTCNERYLDESKNYAVDFVTTKGTFSVELDVKNAPESTAHLAALVKDGFYDGLTFHRVVPSFVIQGGDPNGNGTGGSDCSVISEAPQRPYAEGDFAWAKAQFDEDGTAGSQFFIVTATDAAQIGALGSMYGYAGKVVSGYEVVKAIEAVQTDVSDAPIEKVTITKAELKVSG